VLSFENGGAIKSPMRNKAAEHMFIAESQKTPAENRNNNLSFHSNGSSCNVPTHNDVKQTHGRSYENESFSNYPIIVIEVTLRPSFSTNLVINKNDNVHRIVDDFCKQNKLSNDKKYKLLEVASQQLQIYNSQSYYTESQHSPSLPDISLQQYHSNYSQFQNRDSYVHDPLTSYANDQFNERGEERLRNIPNNDIENTSSPNTNQYYSKESQKLLTSIDELNTQED